MIPTCASPMRSRKGERSESVNRARYGSRRGEAWNAEVRSAVDSIGGSRGTLCDIRTSAAGRKR